MKAYQPTSLGRSVVRFFQDYLPTLRGMSRHTIRSYRDAMILFLGFCAEDCRRDKDAGAPRGVSLVFYVRLVTVRKAVLARGGLGRPLISLTFPFAL